MSDFKLELLWEAISKNEADIVEKAAILSYRSKHPNGYNLADGGGGVLGLKSALGHKVSEDVRKILSEANLGNKNASGKRTGQALKNMQEAVIDHSKLIERNNENNPMKDAKTVLKWRISRLKTSIKREE